MADDSEIQRLSLLLPFYVNGTLDAEECAEIDAALATSPALREELSLLGQLAQSVKTGGRELTQGNEPDFDSVEARLDDMEASDQELMPTAEGNPVRQENLAGILAFLHPKRWHPVVALSLALAVALQAGFIANLAGKNEQGASKIASLEKRIDEVEFQLASGPGGTVGVGSIMVQIADGASWAELAILLTDEGLTIVAGPSDGTLTLSSEAKAAELDAQIARLKKSALIAAADKAV